MNPDWTCLPVPVLSYSYDVPEGWSTSSNSAPVYALPDVELTGLSVTGAYDCGSRAFNRGGASGAVVPRTALTTVVKGFADKLATQYCNSAPQFEVKLGEPKPVTIPNGASSIQGVQVDATATTSGADPKPPAEADLQAMIDSVKPLSRG